MKILEKPRPRAFGAVRDDGVGVLGRFVRHQRDVNSTQHHRHTRRPVAIGQRIGFVDLGRERRDADEVERLELHSLRHFRELAVRHLHFGRRQRRDGKKAEAGERCDHAAAVDELRKRDPKLGKLGRADPNTAHGDEPDPHHAYSISKASTALRNSARVRISAICWSVK